MVRGKKRGKRGGQPQTQVGEEPQDAEEAAKKQWIIDMDKVLALTARAETSATELKVRVQNSKSVLIAKKHAALAAGWIVKLEKERKAAEA